VIVEVDGWVLGEKLDAVLDVMRAVAADVSAAGCRPAPEHPGQAVG
jgi:hypothetical protein